MMPSPDADLAKALETLAYVPDPTAWALVLERTGPAMEALARRLTGDGELARDAVQEALLQIRDSASSFRPPAEDADRAARSWILRVTANTALVLRRRQMRLQRRERVVSMQNTNPSPAVDCGLAADELTDRMRSELAALPEPTRAAIVLHHCSGLAFSDVATALGIPEGTAKVRVHRGLTMLRERLVRAGFACSLLAISGLLQQLPAAKIPVSFTSTSAANRLLTAPATSTVAFIQRGLSMTTLTSLATGAAVLLIGTISVLFSQDPSTPVPRQPVAPAPSSTTPLTGSEIHPLPITADPIALAKMKSATPSMGSTWEDRFSRTDRRGFTLNFWTSSKRTLQQPCSVPFGSDWKISLDALAKEAGEVWRMRGTAAEFISPELAAKLTAQLNGRSAPSGSRTKVLAWFARHTGLTLIMHRSLGADDDRLFRWAPQTATNEAWLDGLAKVLKATALVSPDGSVLFYQPPAIVPLDNDPEFIAKGSRLVYQAPPVARLDTEVTLDFKDTELADVAKVLQQVLHYPVEVDPEVLKTVPWPTTLRVESMKLRYVVGFVEKLFDLEAKILPDRLRLTRRIANPPPPGETIPVLPSAPQ